MPRAPKGFQVSEFATGLRNPRKIVTAPNGDIFVAESMPGRIKLLRDADGDGKAEMSEDLRHRTDHAVRDRLLSSGPNPTHVYIGNTNSVVRFPYQNGDTKARGPAEVIVKSIPSGRERVGGGGHWTRDLEFSKDGKTLFVSVGSRSNVSDDAAARNVGPTSWPSTPTARTSGSTPGAFATPSAWRSIPRPASSGPRSTSATGSATTWCPTTSPTSRKAASTAGPGFTSAAHQDPRHKDKHPELKDKVIVPDVLVQSHSASLCMTFYTGAQFPPEYRLDAFAAEHGSWNRARRTGYKVIRVPLKDGKATGEYEDFLVGFVTPEGNVWGRPGGRRPWPRTAPSWSPTTARESSGGSPTPGQFKISPMSKASSDHVGLIFALAVTTCLPLLAQADPGWIGKRVVPKARNFTLRRQRRSRSSGAARRSTFIGFEQVDGPVALASEPETPGLDRLGRV